MKRQFKIIAMIPARYASSRFPGKMLASLGGKPVIVRTCEAAAGMGLFDEVYAVTDDSRIREAVTAAGIPCIMSRREHETGSDRIAEAVEGLDCDIVVNIQGDEPFTRKEVIEQVLRPFYMEDGDSIDLCTLKEQMDSHEDISNPNNVKVITDISGSALYFSRSPIPYPRDPRSGARWWRHIGIYAFRRQALEMFSRWPMGELEASEKIECLRFLEHGRRIKVVETSGMRVSIDTPEDLAKAERILKGG
ncbi:MAG TPA: 3-deoxy-manno-octulosonate cytidylyltransferase [Candidatus Coprenecus stercorigallinarum]|nr:3-deoxy-manno-octulosonate cytidylyltransferase [Candidatus Coprenecus stercorigallinarum]